MLRYVLFSYRKTPREELDYVALMRASADSEKLGAQQEVNKIKQVFFLRWTDGNFFDNTTTPEITLKYTKCIKSANQTWKMHL